MPGLQQRKAAPPFGGDRRLWAYRRVVEQVPVHKQRVRRLMREHHLLVQPHLRLQAKRPPTRSNPRPTQPNEWWGLDMTKVMVTGLGGRSIVGVLDGYTKQIGGDSAGVPGPTPHGLAALNRAVHQPVPEGARGLRGSLRSDTGCQPPSLAFREACRTLESQPAFTSANHPKGNAATARVIRTVKEECRWVQAWTCPLALVSALAAWIDDDNAP